MGKSSINKIGILLSVVIVLCAGVGMWWFIIKPKMDDKASIVATSGIPSATPITLTQQYSPTPTLTPEPTVTTTPVIQAGRVTLLVVNPDSGERIGNAKITLTSLDGALIGTDITDSSGLIIFDDVTYGTYTASLSEVNGVVLDSSENKNFNLQSSSVSVQFEFETNVESEFESETNVDTESESETNFDSESASSTDTIETEVEEDTSTTINKVSNSFSNNTVVSSPVKTGDFWNSNFDYIRTALCLLVVGILFLFINFIKQGKFRVL
jgi:hypothetical protein